ncbi:MAG: hypothetical protein D6682_03025 [Zetaproteobacteria bacterium]|nr:MAG: hypothetical protein D6682_03025 [Zetaproteobacteria bacterium]
MPLRGAPRLVAILLAGGLLTAGHARATTIEAQQMVADRKLHRARFHGDVELISRQLHIRSDTLTAYYRDRLGGRLDRAEASGHVRLRREKMRGRADHATFDEGRQLLILSGNAELTEGGRLIRGGRIEHRLDSGESRVTEGEAGERVHLHIDDDRRPLRP